MYPRTNYEMSEEDLEEILKACQPVPMIMLQCGTPSSPQENANRAWSSLGKKMGFDSDTIKPIPGKGNRFFSAVPSETETQREERIKKEAKERRVRRVTEIKRVEEEIDRLNNELKVLIADG